MKPVLIVLCILIAGNATAQGLSAGVRTGASHWIAVNHDGSLIKPTNQIAWEKGLYARYEAKRFAYELQAVNYNFYVPQLPATYPNPMCGVTSPTRTLSESSFSKTNEYSLSVQYRLSGKHSKFKNYIGLSLTSNFSRSYYQYLSEDTITLQRYSARSVHRGFQDFYGIDHYMSYSLNKHLNLHAATSLKIDPRDVMFSFPVNGANNSYSKFCVNIGCGYTF